MARPVERWLETFMCGQYAETFEAYGYKTLQLVCQLNPHQLQAMGVLPDHCEKIMENVSVLRQSYMAKRSAMGLGPPGFPAPVDPVVNPASTALASVARSAHRGGMGGFGDGASGFMNNQMAGMNYQQQQNNSQMGGGMPHGMEPYQGQGYYGQGQGQGPGGMWPQSQPPPQMGQYGSGPYMSQGGPLPPQQQQQQQHGGMQTHQTYGHPQYGPGPGPGGYGGQHNPPYSSGSSSMGGGGGGGGGGMGGGAAAAGRGGPSGMYSSNMAPHSSSQGNTPMHHHIRQQVQGQQAQTPQQVADSILQLASGSFPGNGPMPVGGPQPPGLSKYQAQQLQSQMGQMPPQHSPHMMQNSSGQFSSQYTQGQMGHQPNQMNASHMAPGQGQMGQGQMGPGQQFMYPNTTQIPSVSQASPMSPHQARSPASVHSNHSLPSTSPGPMKSPAPGPERSPATHSVASPGLAGMRSPSMQPMTSPMNCNQPMRSPMHSIPHPTPSPLPQMGGPGGQPSPASMQMRSPSNQGPQGHFSPSNSYMNSSSSHSSPSYSTCSQPQASQAPPSSSSVYGDGGHQSGVTYSMAGHHPQQQQQQQQQQHPHHPQQQPQQQQQQQQARNDKQPTFDPLQSLQKLVMLPESQVIDPKSVVNDACLPNSNESSKNDEPAKNVEAPPELYPEPAAQAAAGSQQHCEDGKHCGSDAAAAATVSAKADVKPVDAASVQPPAATVGGDPSQSSAEVDTCRGAENTTTTTKEPTVAERKPDQPPPPTQQHAALPKPTRSARTKASARAKMQEAKAAAAEAEAAARREKEQVATPGEPAAKRRRRGSSPGGKSPVCSPVRSEGPEKKSDPPAKPAGLRGAGGGGGKADGKNGKNGNNNSMVCVTSNDQVDMKLTNGPVVKMEHLRGDAHKGVPNLKEEESTASREVSEEGALGSSDKVPTVNGVNAADEHLPLPKDSPVDRKAKKRKSPTKRTTSPKKGSGGSGDVVESHGEGSSPVKTTSKTDAESSTPRATKTVKKTQPASADTKPKEPERNAQKKSSKAGGSSSSEADAKLVKVPDGEKSVSRGESIKSQGGSADKSDGTAVTEKAGDVGTSDKTDEVNKESKSVAAKSDKPAPGSSPKKTALAGVADKKRQEEAVASVNISDGSSMKDDTKKTSTKAEVHKERGKTESQPVSSRSKGVINETSKGLSPEKTQVKLVASKEKQVENEDPVCEAPPVTPTRKTPRGAPEKDKAGASRPKKDGDGKPAETTNKVAVALQSNLDLPSEQLNVEKRDEQTDSKESSADVVGKREEGKTVIGKSDGGVVKTGCDMSANQRDGANQTQKQPVDKEAGVLPTKKDGEPEKKASKSAKDSVAGVKKADKKQLGKSAKKQSVEKKVATASSSPAKSGSSGVETASERTARRPESSKGEGSAAISSSPVGEKQPPQRDTNGDVTVEEKNLCPPLEGPVAPNKRKRNPPSEATKTAEAGESKPKLSAKPGCASQSGASLTANVGKVKVSSNTPKPKEPVAPGKEPTAGTKDPATGPKEGKALPKEHTTSLKEAMVAAKEPATVSKDTKAVVKESPVAPKDAKVMPKEPSTVSKDAKAPAKESATNVKEAKDVAKEPTAATKEPTKVAADEPTLVTKEAKVPPSEPTTVPKESKVAAVESTPASKDGNVAATERTTLPKEVKVAAKESLALARDSKAPAKDTNKTPTKEPKTVARDSKTVTKEPKALTKDSKGLVKEPKVSSKESATVSKEPTTMPKESASVAKEAATISKEPTSLPSEQAPVAKEPSTVAKEPTVGSKEAANAAKEPCKVLTRACENVVNVNSAVAAAEANLGQPNGPVPAKHPKTELRTDTKLKQDKEMLPSAVKPVTKDVTEKKEIKPKKDLSDEVKFDKCSKDLTIKHSGLSNPDKENDTKNKLLKKGAETKAMNPSNQVDDPNKLDFKPVPEANLFKSPQRNSPKKDECGVTLCSVKLDPIDRKLRMNSTSGLLGCSKPLPTKADEVRTKMPGLPLEKRPPATPPLPPAAAAAADGKLATPVDSAKPPRGLTACTKEAAMAPMDLSTTGSNASAKLESKAKLDAALAQAASGESDLSEARPGSLVASLGLTPRIKAKGKGSKLEMIARNLKTGAKCADSKAAGKTAVSAALAGRAGAAAAAASATSPPPTTTTRDKRPTPASQTSTTTSTEGERLSLVSNPNNYAEAASSAAPKAPLAPSKSSSTANNHVDSTPPHLPPKPHHPVVTDSVMDRPSSSLKSCDSKTSPSSVQKTKRDRKYDSSSSLSSSQPGDAHSRTAFKPSTLDASQSEVTDLSVPKNCSIDYPPLPPPPPPPPLPPPLSHPPTAPVPLLPPPPPPHPSASAVPSKHYCPTLVTDKAVPRSLSNESEKKHEVGRCDSAGDFSGNRGGHVGAASTSPARKGIRRRRQPHLATLVDVPIDIACEGSGGGDYDYVVPVKRGGKKIKKELETVVMTAQVKTESSRPLARPPLRPAGGAGRGRRGSGGGRGQARSNATAAARMTPGGQSQSSAQGGGATAAKPPSADGGASAAKLKREPGATGSGHPSGPPPPPPPPAPTASASASAAAAATSSSTPTCSVVSPEATGVVLGGARKGDPTSSDEKKKKTVKSEGGGGGGSSGGGGGPSQVPSTSGAGDGSSPSSRNKSENKKRGRPFGSKNKVPVKRKRRKAGGANAGGGGEGMIDYTQEEQSLKAILKRSAEGPAGVGGKKKKVESARGPVVRLTGPRDSPLTCEVINSSDWYEAERASKEKKGHKDKTASAGGGGGGGASASAAAPTTFVLSDSVPWLCAFCGKGSNHETLGDLFGPYYPENYTPTLTAKRAERSATSTAVISPTAQSADPRPSTSAATTSPSAATPAATSSAGAGAAATTVASSSTSPTSAADTPLSASTKRRRRRKLSISPGDESCVRRQRRRRSRESSSGSLVGSPRRDSVGEELPPEIWVHEECAVWSHGVYIAGGKLHGLEDAIAHARQQTCSHCRQAGANLGCYSKGCNLKFHYLCATERDCLLDEENFTLVCPKHKDKKVKMMSSSSNLS